VLAVSGGLDSMVMATYLHALAPERIAAVATFDHGTGSSATAAARAVGVWAATRGLQVRVGATRGLPASEASWRAARWDFLSRMGDEFGAPVATAHTEDDQAETVFIRLLRGSGVRGLAGLLAPSRVVRPLVTVSRAEVHDFARLHDVPFTEDPSNSDLRYLRNRVRRQLLPAAERHVPGFRLWLLELGRAAAEWRCDVRTAVDQFWTVAVSPDRSSVRVNRDRRRPPSREQAALFWPDVAGRIGVALDRRGTDRLASFSTTSVTGQSMPLSGGVSVITERECWTLRRAEADVVGEAPANRLALRRG